MKTGQRKLAGLLSEKKMFKQIRTQVTRWYRGPGTYHLERAQQWPPVQYC